MIITPEELKPRRVLLVEDETMSRTLLAGVLRGAGFEVAACASAAEASKRFASFDPDAMVCDIDLGRGPTGLDLVLALTRRAPYLAVVIVSNYTITPDYRHEVLARAAYIRKQDLSDIDGLVGALEAALHDRVPRPRIGSAGVSRLSVLTASQVQVLRMVAEGLGNEEIATRRGTSVKSVEHMVGRILLALEIGGDSRLNPRVAAARLYIEEAGLPSSSILGAADEPAPDPDGIAG